MGENPLWLETLTPLGAAFRGLLAAPPGTIRNGLLGLPFVCLVGAIGTAITAKWLGVLGFGSGFVVLLVFALIDQHESEVSGKVERERQRQAEVFAKRAAWPTWKRRLFCGSSAALLAR